MHSQWQEDEDIFVVQALAAHARLEYQLDQRRRTLNLIRVVVAFAVTLGVLLGMAL